MCSEGSLAILPRTLFVPPLDIMLRRSILALIKLARRVFRNTWVHRLRITTFVYRRLFGLVNRGGMDEIGFRGLRLVLPADDISMTPTILSGEYEAFELDLFERLIKPGITMIDVGANIGIYSLIAGKRGQPTGRVFAFEPVPENLDHLHRNIQLNGLTNVDTIPAAVGDERGRTRIALSPKEFGTHAIATETYKGRGLSAHKAYVEVPITTIDKFVNDRSIQPDVIKIDIEGYEPFAVRGGLRTLRQQPALFIEFSADLIRRYGEDPLRMLSSLVHIYDRCYVIEERHRRLVHIGEPTRIQGLWNGNLLLLSSESAGRLMV